MNSKNINKQNLDEVLIDFNLSDAKASKGFENNLREKFLKEAFPEKRMIFGFINRRIPLIFSMFLVFSLVAFIGFSFDSSNKFQVRAQTFERIYSVSPQSALMPVFAKLKNLTNKDLEKAMNISDIPFLKDNYGTSTTTTINYGQAYEQCEDLFRFNSAVKKTITFESYRDGTYKFKTHVFDENNTEIELLISDGAKYFSEKQNKTLGTATLDFSSIDKFIPDNLYQTNTNDITWEDSMLCSGKNQIIQSKIIFNSDNSIQSFEINLQDSAELIYKASFEIKKMTNVELILVDDLFKI